MIYKVSDINLIKDILVKEKKTLAVGESVTSGHLQAAFSQAANASDFFQGGITVYNAGQKCRHLHIEPIQALKNNCVSEDIACTMARESSKMFLSDYGIGITGYAAKVPEQGITKLFSYCAINLGDKIILSKKILPSRDLKEGLKIQLDYTAQVIALFLKILKSKKRS